MSPESWQEYLARFLNGRSNRALEPNPSATSDQITEKEIKLGVKFPPSYRAFLATSNGLRSLSEDQTGLREVEKLKWFGKEHREWADAYTMAASGIESPLHDSDYFDYGVVDCVKFEPKHLAQCLCISDPVDESVVLLNPMVVWPDGEWETWYFSNSLPGAVRFRSFVDWMHSRWAGIVDEPTDGSRMEAEMPTIYRDSPTKPDRRVVKPIKIPPLDVVLKDLSSTKESVRAKTIKALCRIGGREAVVSLINAMQHDSSGEIRCQAAIALGHLKAAEAIGALVAAIADPAINSSAVHALGQIRNEVAVDYLLKLIETKMEYWGVGAYCLAQRGEERSIPLLAAIVISERDEDHRDGLIAVSVLAEYGTESAFMAVAQHARHPNIKVRERVMRGLYYFAFGSKKRAVTMRARELLASCEAAETNEALRKSIENSLGAIPRRR